MSEVFNLSEAQQKKFLHDIKRDYIPQIIYPICLMLMVVFLCVTGVYRGALVLEKVIVCIVSCSALTIPLWLLYVLDYLLLKKSFLRNSFTVCSASNIRTRWRNRVPYDTVEYDVNGKTKLAWVDIDDKIEKGDEVVHLKGLYNHIYSVKFLKEL